MEIDGNITSDGEIDSNNESDHRESEEESMEDEERELVLNDTRDTEQEISQSNDESMDEEEIQRRREAKRKRKQEKRECRESMEKKLDTLSSSLQVMQELIVENGLLSSKQRKRSGQNSKGNVSFNSLGDSETTIYRDAIPPVDLTDQRNAVEQFEIPVNAEITFSVKNNRQSSSSEDKIDTSDEMIDIKADQGNNFLREVDTTDQFISDCAVVAMQAMKTRQPDKSRKQSDGER